MILTFAPIKVWPEGWQDLNRTRGYSPFNSTYSATITLLDRELDALRATSAQLQVDARPNQVRGDGQLRSDAKVDHPGVILTIETRQLGTLVYATDRFQGRWGKPPWHDNLRAIALGLEALRKVERYGIAERGQQYAGYRELGSGIPIGQEAAPTMSVDEAAAYMAKMAWPNDAGEHHGEDVEFILTDPDVADMAYKLAAKRSHPDVGGDTETFKKLGEARRIVAMGYRR